jgi:hypothetical protein
MNTMICCSFEHGLDGIFLADQLVSSLLNHLLLVLVELQSLDDLPLAP